GIVFVRWITRPVSARRIDLADEEPIGGKCRRHDVDDLPGRVATAPDFEAAIDRANDARGQRLARRRSTIRNLARFDGFDAELRAGRQVDAVRIRVEDIGARPDPVTLASPGGVEPAAEQDEAALL